MSATEHTRTWRIDEVEGWDDMEMVARGGGVWGTYVILRAWRPETRTRILRRIIPGHFEVVHRAFVPPWEDKDALVARWTDEAIHAERLAKGL